MLVATSEVRIGAGGVRSALLLERAVRGTVVVRDQLAFDTRFAAAAAGKPERVGHVFLLVEGRLVRESAVHQAPAAFVLGDDEVERVGPASQTFRTDGPRVTVIQLRVEDKLLRAPIGLSHGPVAITAWEQARALVATPTSAAVLAALLKALEPLVAPIAITLEEPERLRRFWSAIEPLYHEYGATMSIKQIASALGLSLRQVGRDAKELASTFGLGDGYRDAMIVLRLRMAALLLSAPGGTVAEVARLVGYGSAIAMARAFRDAKLPAPSAVQSALRGD
ncbi:MAG: helix-turn-helix transcriptional regulator [Deltaproteobacteria bacterium]|nr:helix-turn-helix transcriptional regulator [Deltaproteobacteria bacterium]